MTKYQVPPAKNYQSEVDSSDLEARMARLVGLEEESPSPPSVEENSAELGQPQAEPLEPREVGTTQRVSSNPFAKLAVVGGGTLAAVVIAGVFLTQLMSGGGKKSSTPDRNSLVPETRSQVQLKPPQELQQEEIEALKTKLALSEQAQAVKDAQLSLKTEKPTPIRTAVRSSPRTEPLYSARTRPTIVVQRIQPPPTFRDRQAIASIPPRVITVIRPVRVPQATRPQIPSYVAPPLQPTVPTPVAQATPTPTPDPLQESERLSKLGSYGQVSSATTPKINVSVEPRKPLITAQTPPVVQPVQPSVVATRTTSSPKSLVVGTTAKAVLATAAFGESTRTIPGRYYNNNNRNTNGGNFNRNKSNDNSDNNDDQDKNIFIVQLKEALKAADGSVALPAQTQLLTRASFSDKGLAQFEVLKAVWQENGQRIEKSVPENTLTIRGPQSKPLIATEYKGSGGGSRFGSDLKVFALGGASKIGEVLNTPDSQVVSLPSTIKNSDGTINSTTTSAVLNQPRRNILAGVLDGGGRAIVPEITRRETQDNARRSIDRTSLWTLSKGKEVTVFVNQATQL